MLHSSGRTVLVAPAPSPGARSAADLSARSSKGVPLSNAAAVHRDTDLSGIRIQRDASTASHWCFMHARQAFADSTYRPCFSAKLVRELVLFGVQTSDAIAQCAADDDSYLAHVVLASDAPVFNLGGDLGLFSQLIRARDRDGLLRYARECVDGVYLYTGLSPNAHTIALVEGDALGGGFELALACQTLVAESDVPMGFPEVLSGLFPGMGAYSLLLRRCGPKVAEDMMLNGVIYKSDELHGMGIVDVLVPKGEGVRAVHDVIRRNRSIATARLALRRVRDAVNPVSLDELTMISEIWVDTALQLGEKSLRRMERLVRAQLRSAGAERALRSLPAWDLMGQEADFDATSRSSAAPCSGAARRLRDRGLRSAAPVAATGF